MVLLKDHNVIDNYFLFFIFLIIIQSENQWDSFVLCKYFLRHGRWSAKTNIPMTLTRHEIPLIIKPFQSGSNVQFFFFYLFFLFSNQLVNISIQVKKVLKAPRTFLWLGFHWIHSFLTLLRIVNDKEWNKSTS